MALRRAVRHTERTLDYTRPLRLGRDSIVYRVIGAEPQAGLLAGVPALILQVLQPAIGAGVHAHSTFKSQPIRRLRRTAEYVGGTAFADDETALALVERVSKRHLPVRGINPITGERFSADDPELQVYVHVTEMWAFLAAFKFLGGAISGEEEDRYWAELAPIGALLGAPLEQVPASAAEARATLARMEPQLRVTPEGRDIIDWLLAPSGSPLLTALRPLMPVNKLAVAAMLPRSIRALVGLPTSTGGDRLARAALRALNRASKPFLARLALRLAGPAASRFYTEIPDCTSERGFALPLAGRDAPIVSPRGYPRL